MDAFAKTPKEVKIMASIMSMIDKTSSNNFNNEKLCRLSVLEYLDRIYKYSECHAGCFIMALILIDRVMQAQLKLVTKLPFCIYR